MSPSLATPLATLSLAGFAGRNVDSNLREIPLQMATNALPFQESYYFAANALWNPWKAGPLRMGLDSSFLKHNGIQTNGELSGGFALTLQHFISPLRTSVAFTAVEGLSYAFGEPRIEKGRYGKRSDFVHFQNHLAFEIRLTHALLPQWSLPLRLHHRSGVYGLFGPPQIGSNFLALGVRWGDSGVEAAQ